MVVEPDNNGATQAGSTEHPHDFWTVANIITLMRLILVPFFFTVLISDRSDVLAFALFASAASTDWLDGWIARRTGTVTAIGKAIDPLVDRLLLASGVVGLYLVGRLPILIVVVLVVRDVYLLYGAYQLEQYGKRMPVTYPGKVTTALLLAGFSLLMLGWPELDLAGRTWALGELFVYTGLVFSVSTAVQYTVLARRMVRGAARVR